MRLFLFILLTTGIAGVCLAQPGAAQSTTGKSKLPVVAVPTRRGTPPATPNVSSPSATQTRIPTVVPRSQSPVVNGVYPWRKNITATVFWVGEKATHRNPVANDKSSWDSEWSENFGGIDDPDPQKRALHRPAGFIPRQNPFYVALPYNDVTHGKHKPEASRVIPWFRRDFERPGKSVCKGKWVQIWYNGRYCFAQWEDCGPFTTDDWEYVFGDSPPKNKANNGAGIDISPAVRDYLGIKGGQAVVNWRFVDFSRIRPGPWAQYGNNNPFKNPHLDPRRQRIERLRKQRDQIQRNIENTDLNKLRRQLQG